MNAPTDARYLAPATKLLFSRWQQTDELQLDLHGFAPTKDDGHEVTKVTLVGDDRNISELFTPTQLEKMGEWLDLKDDVRPALRAAAERSKQVAMRQPYERGNASY